MSKHTLGLRPNFGTVFIPAMFGLKYKVPKDTFAWISSHLTKGEIKKFRLPNLEKIDMMKRATDGGKRGLILHFDEAMFPEYTCQDIFQKWRKIMSC